MNSGVRIGVIGLGYVGLPVAVGMAKKFPVVGFDISARRIEDLKGGLDRTGEISREELEAARALSFSSSREGLSSCNFFIVTVPTPIDAAKRPNLTPLIEASRTVGGLLKPSDFVVYESTVYPGATEEICVPILEKESGLAFNHDFFVGYSPERINPGDPDHRLESITKVVSGSTPKAAETIERVYGAIIDAGVHLASSIAVAEAAKVIENIQRDVNIALVNELAMLFNVMGLDVFDVLEAAQTKWNFHNYKPGLVGGHCIGVDPYYLTYKAQSIDFHPEMILAGRRINDSMARFYADDLIRSMLKHKIKVYDSRILVLGLTFKENCPDLRNTKVTDLVDHLAETGAKVEVYDPFADPVEAKETMDIDLLGEMPKGQYDAVVLAVAHKQFRGPQAESLKGLLTPNGVFYDLKGVLRQGSPS